MRVDLKLTSGALASLLLASCAATMPGPRYLRQPSAVFHAADAAWAAQPGKNTISGSALMRTMTGDVKTCAGLLVELIPDTPYARERMTISFGSPEGGYFPASNLTAPSPDPEYTRSVRRSVCDAQGSFSFEGLPDGSYFLTASVVWNIPVQNAAFVQGGDIMQHVSVSGGEVRKIVLTK
jgi:hypothetical protein